MRGQSSITAYTGGSSEHPAAVPWKCADVLTGLRKQISSVEPGASGVASMPRAVKLGGSERGLQAEPPSFHSLAGEPRHMLFNLLFWPQFPHTKENVKLQLITVLTS